MASGGSGADFWGPNFGFYDLREFTEKMNDLYPSVLPFENLGLNQTNSGLAWEAPWSPMGTLAQSLLTRDGYNGNEKSSAGSIVQIIAGMVQQVQAEANMAQVIIPGAFQVNIGAVSGGQNVENVVGVVNSGGTASGAAAAVQTAWKAANGPLTRLPQTYVLSAFRAVDLSSPDGDIAEISDNSPGLNTGSKSTNAACALVQWNGSTRSRSSRGRLYFGPIPEGVINTDGRTIDAADLTLYTQSFQVFRDSLTASGYTLAVLSRKQMQAHPVTSHRVESVIATQRRRIRS